MPAVSFDSLDARQEYDHVLEDILSVSGPVGILGAVDMKTFGCFGAVIVIVPKFLILRG